VPARRYLKSGSRWFRGEGFVPEETSRAAVPLENSDDIDPTALADVMRSVPWGAAVLAGTTVALLVIGYILIYLLVFVPRGTVG
jgi:hypothetical protein